ncbi:MAG: FMN-binding negative transcriptional regulator [Phyllobacteriaceae bacterium]|nr:FMN-binding negative transcriptional regulator [Phyllobacteriaceae bacterium]
MYTPPAFLTQEPAELRRIMREARLPTLITAGAEGLVATHLPMILDEAEGEHGTLYGHLAKANGQWKGESGEALVIFLGPDTYVSPSWYRSKLDGGKVVPTWNYEAVHACGPAEFFDDPERLRSVVRRQTDRHEADREHPWAVGDAPDAYIRAQLRGIVGVHLEIARMEGKRKFSQNRSLTDRQDVAAGLGASTNDTDRSIAAMLSTEDV